MELSWTTFILEAINFLVLVWLLKRLFYAPVKREIDRRRAGVEKTLHDAESTRHAAENLKSQYEGRLQEWETEKERQREEFRKELTQERTKQMKLIEASVATEREKLQVQEEKKAAERRANDQRQATKQALEFATRLLNELASPELEGTILELVAKHISSDGLGEFSSTQRQFGNDAAGVLVRSAYTLADRQRLAISKALQNKLGTEIAIAFEVDPKLLAGVEIAAGSLVLRANLRDELGYFSASANHE